MYYDTTIYMKKSDLSTRIEKGVVSYDAKRGIASTGITTTRERGIAMTGGNNVDTFFIYKGNNVDTL